MNQPYNPSIRNLVYTTLSGWAPEIYVGRTAEVSLEISRAIEEKIVADLTDLWKKNGDISTLAAIAFICDRLGIRNPDKINR